MIDDARSLPSGHELRCDVCIIGAGPAGIALALELGKKGIDVVLLESGGRKFDAAANDMNRGSVSDSQSHGALEDYRRRRLGGATTAWGGRSAPFDPIDFEAREFVPNSGWPFGFDALKTYYSRANDYCECGSFDYSVASIEGRRDFIPGLASPDVTTESIYRFSPPTNFGARYSDALEQSTRIKVYLLATAERLVTNPEKTAVTHVDVRTGTGRKLKIAPKRVVLAGGGLEATRLMLLSEVGNENDLLGRFYMCHVTNRIDLSLEDARGLIWDYEKTRDGVYCQRTLAPAPDVQRKRHILNSRARVEHPEIADPAHKSGALSAVYLAKYALTRQAQNPLLSDAVNVLNKGVAGTATLVAPVEHASNVARDFGAVVTLGRRWLTKRMFSKRKLPSVVLPTRTSTYTLRIDAEQAPNPESRVTLSDDRDATGARRLHVDWRASELDKASLVRTAALFDEALSAQKLGHAVMAPPTRLQATGGHHLGTTRMDADCKRGVVDVDCKVHGIANAFVASGSVFPTCGYANPTLTIVALALRLADHLEAQKS